MNNYNLMFETQSGISSQYITTEIDLMDQYKIAIIRGKGYIMWENGVIDCSKVVGITRSK